MTHIIGAFGDAIAAFADSMLHGTGKAPNVAIGPVVWGIDDGHDARHWYFIVASIGAKKGELRIDQFKIGPDDRDLAEQARAALSLALLQRRPIVVHDFDDELALAKWCEALCPGKRSRRIREDLERERQPI